MSPPLPPDPYKILGIAKDAQTTAIRSAHRKLVLKCHPDKVQDPKLKAEKQDEFQKVQQAYELLIDDNERQKYDDKVKLADLRKQMQDKANISTPRSTRYSSRSEMPSPDLRSSSFARSSPPPSGGKSYSYKQFYDADLGQGIRIETTHVRPSSRRDPSFTYKPSKREMEREREREKDMDRDRRRKEDDRRAAEKAEKEAMRAEKKHREKILLKQRKRETEEKQRHTRPTIIDDFEDDAPRKRSGSKKFEEKRERYDSSREDVTSRPPTSRPAMGSRHYSTNTDSPLDRAQSYMEASRAKAGSIPGLQRSASYSPRNSAMPSAPTPPPANNKPFVLSSDSDEDFARRSSAKSRRGSGDSPRASRERYGKGSREVLEDHIAASPSPATRHPPKFTSSASATPKMPGSPRFELRRTETMPVSPDPGHPMPGISRAQTFGAYGEKPLPRGRERSRMQSQVAADDSDSEEYERRRERKYRSSRKTHSPEPLRRAESISRYQYEGSGRTRRIDPYPGTDPYGHYASDYSVRMSDQRRPSHVRESSYTGSPGMSRYADDIITSKAYSRDDVNWSNNYVDRGDYRRYPVRV